MSTQNRILSDIDKSRLFDLADSQWLNEGGSSARVRGLNRLLNHARFVDAREVPPDVVTMNSRLRIAVRGREAPREVTIVFPEEASQPDGRISILAPMAQALLGARVGDTVTWEAPIGRVSARVEALLHQPEASVNRS